MYDFNDIEIITHVRLDNEERIRNFHIREEFYHRICKNIHFTYIEDDKSEKLIRILNGTQTYKFEHNIGPVKKTSCYNIGAQYTKRPFLCFLDLDCIVHPSQILRSRDEIKKTKNAGMVYPFNGVALYLKLPAKRIVEQHPTYNTIHQFLPAHLVTSFSDDNVLVGSTQAPGGCFLCPADKFEEYNGFNPYFKGWGYEDNEFAKRIHILGYDVLRLSRIEDVLWHLPHEDELASNKANHQYHESNRLICSEVENSTKEQLKEYIRQW